MHYYQFHIGDYKSHTHHLSLIEDIAYRRLLDHYYLHEVPIKQREVARQIGMRDYEQEVLSVLDEFFLNTEHGYINPRADVEISKYKEFSAAGKRGAEKRWLKPADSPPMATPLAGDSPPNATPIATINQEPLPNNHKPITNIKIQAPQGVSLEVWESFLSQRKLSKATVTETVIKSIQKEADKANWTLEQALSEIVARGWRGFKADWVIKTQDKSEKNNELISGLTRGLLGGTKNVKLLNN